MAFDDCVVSEAPHFDPTRQIDDYLKALALTDVFAFGVFRSTSRKG